MSVRFRYIPCCSLTFWAIVWPSSICTTLLRPSQKAAPLWPSWRTSQVRHGSNHDTQTHTTGALDLRDSGGLSHQGYSLLVYLCCLISCIPSSSIPLVIAHHASIYLTQLLATNCGQVTPCPTLSNTSALISRPCPPIHQLLSTDFPAKLFFFSFQWLNQDQEAVRYAEPQLAKEWWECPGELSVPITSDYLQFYPKMLSGEGEKVSNCTLPAVYSK